MTRFTDNLFIMDLLNKKYAYKFLNIVFFIVFIKLILFYRIYIMKKCHFRRKKHINHQTFQRCCFCFTGNQGNRNYLFFYFVLYMLFEFIVRFFGAIILTISFNVFPVVAVTNRCIGQYELVKKGGVVFPLQTSIWQ